MYTDACSLENKQEDLELHVQSPNSLTGITKRQWENLHGWSAVVDGCKLNSKHRQKMRIELPSIVKEQPGHTDLSYRRDGSLAESLAESRGKDGMGDAVAQVCYPSSQVKEADKAISKQLEDNICHKYSVIPCRKSNI